MQFKFALMPIVMNWNDLKTLLVIYRKKTIPSAAETLDVNETTIRRRLKRLESSLGTRLFERTASGLVATVNGELVVKTAERVELETQQLSQTVSGDVSRIAGKVKLTSVPMLMNQVLIPALDSLVSAYPDLELELIADADDLSLIKREADVALRLSRPTIELQAIARKIGHIDYAKYCRVGLDDKELRWINYSRGMNYLPQSRWISRKESLSPIEVNDAEGLLSAVRSGLGKALFPSRIADDHPELKRIDGETAVTREVWVMIHPDLQHLARIRVVIDWLISIFDSD